MHPEHRYLPPPRPFQGRAVLFDAWPILSREFGALVGAHLVMLLICLAAAMACVVPFYIVFGPLMVGYCRMCVRAVRGLPCEIADLFWAFEHRFSESFILGLIFAAVPSLASSLASMPLTPLLGVLMSVFSGSTINVAAISLIVSLFALVILLPPVVVTVLYMPAFFYLLDGWEREPWPVMEASRRRVMANLNSWLGFWAWIVVPHLLVLLTCGLAIVVVNPWTLVGVALAYERELGHLTPPGANPPPGTPAPPPISPAGPPPSLPNTE